MSGPPLHLAINNQNLAMVKELLELGASTQPRIPKLPPGITYSLSSYLGTHWPLNGYQEPPNSIPTQPNTASWPSWAALQHADIVFLSISELLKQGEENLFPDIIFVDIFMMVLAAHGHLLGVFDEIFSRILINLGPKKFPLVLHKLYLCSRYNSEEMITSKLNPQFTETRANSRPVISLERDLNRLRTNPKPPRNVTSLQNQARRVVRQSLMDSGHNVLWACKRLECPPALKSVILLKDIDRAFSPPPPWQTFSSSQMEDTQHS